MNSQSHNMHRPKAGTTATETETRVGWKATIPFLILLLLLAYPAWRYAVPRTTLPEGAISAIARSLEGFYGSPAAQSPVFIEEAAPGSNVPPPDKDALKWATKVSLPQVSVRGFGSTVAAKVQVQVGGRTPPDGVDVRFVRLHYSPLLGWRAEVLPNAIRYNLTFL